MTRANEKGRTSGLSNGVNPRVLVIDDEADLRELLDLTIAGMGLGVDCAADLAQARQLLTTNAYALCLTDMRLPDGDGLDLVDLISKEYPATPVAVITAYGSTENAVAAFKAGAFDYLGKPVALEALRSLVRSAIQLPGTGSASGAGQDMPTDVTVRMLGCSAAILDVRSQIIRLARSMAPVAIIGESGSGKELAARLIHETGPRAREPFVAVNCGAIPETLMEAEFFGHKKGSFTGADKDRDGFFQAANGGTMLLDEVADLPLAMQVKLLRSIQEKRVRKVGATIEEPVDVRIISATHQDLAQCVAAGRFRQDLYYRLNVIELSLPPLRDRPEDVVPLAVAILEKLVRRAGIEHAPALSSVTLRYLESYNFPGNVRELENILERSLAYSNGITINVEDLGLRPTVSDDTASERFDAPTRIAGGGSAAGGEIAAAGTGAAGRSVRTPTKVSSDGIPESLPDYLDQTERHAIERALEKTRFNRTAAARLLGISFRALRHRMQRLEIN